MKLSKQLNDGILLYKSTHGVYPDRIVMNRETRNSLLTEVSCVEPEEGTELDRWADVRVKIDPSLPFEIFILATDIELANLELFQQLAAEGEAFNEPSLS